MGPSLPGLSTSSSSLVQDIVDNFDTDISSPNGKSSTHSLVMLLTQPDSNSSETVQEDTIRRVKREDMVEPLEYDVEIERYNGPKKLPVRQNTPKRSVQPLRMLAQQVISKGRASEMDFTFL